MITVNTIAELRQHVQSWKSQGERVAMIPTMGNLHEGHLQLVRHAQTLADRTLVTIFVNPMQFGEGEDYESYPRTLEEDSRQLQEMGTNLLFVPGVKEVYPIPQGEQTRIEVPEISDILCGASRPGHFVGVATVVCKLLNMGQPDVAVFGEKDFQQLMVIRRMVRDLCLPMEIIGVPTVRESDGLAKSSRNGYLTAAERQIAPALYRILQSIAELLKKGASDYTALESKANQAITEAGFKPDYFAIRRSQDLNPPDGEETALTLLVAAYLGKARLIDNLSIDLSV